MSEMSEIDEIMRHTGQFAAKLPQLITHLSQTSKWLDRRRAKKSITRLVRQELKAQEQARRDELKQIAGRIHGYRAHSQAIGARTGDPNWGAERRERDHAALVRHYTDLETDILRSGSLTTVEQGIALDGIAAATTYPQFRLGDLFGRAHKVKGVDALRYRAQVARAQAAAGIARTPAYQRPTPTTPLRVPVAVPPQEQARQYSPGQIEATQEIRRQHAANRQEINAGRPRVYGPEQAQAVAQWAASEGVNPEQIAWEFNNAEANTRLVTKISSRHGDDPEQTQMTGWHPSESESADWAARKIERSYWGPGLGVSATTVDRDSGRPLYRFQGGPGFLADELTDWSQKATQWREQGQQEHRPTGWPAPARGESLDAPLQRTAAQAPPVPEPPEQEPERERLDEVAAERDRLRERVVLLGRGIDAVTADRDDHKRKLDAVQGQLDAAKNTTLRQARELEDLRANSLRLVEMQVERDRFKSERDEAVRKLAANTPARERFGSRERIAADEQLGDTEAMPRETFTAPTDSAVNGNGHQRPGHDPIHRSR